MAMGMEVELHRRITNKKQDRLEGDTRLLAHPWFRLVSDKLTRAGVPFSNMEFVLKRFDQKTVAQNAAVAALTERIAAMRSICTQLYAQTGTLRAVVPPTQGAHQLMYYDGPPYGSTEDLLVADCPGGDDGLLYVHYTVGFTPLEWRAMLTGIAGVVRDDTDVSRSKTHLTNGRAVAEDIADSLEGAVRAEESNPVAAALVRDELCGHLALLYMHAAVFVERTLSLQLQTLTQAKAGKAKIDAVTRQLDFEGGQPKNKIAALPRATLSEMYGVLSEPARIVLAAAAEPILDAIAGRLETAHGLDLPEKFELVSPKDGTASLGDFLKAGLNGVTRISQEVLFGAMKQVGVDVSVHGLNLIPFEFRSVFDGRVTWPELLRDATKVLNWSRNPNLGPLV